MVINLHHLPEMITDYFGDGARLGMDITYSFEPELLGTSGGVKNNAAFLGGETFLVVSGSALTDIDITGLVSAHRRTGSIATLAVKEVADPSLYGGGSRRRRRPRRGFSGETHPRGGPFAPLQLWNIRL